LIFLNTELLDSRLSELREQWRATTTGLQSAIIIDDLLYQQKRQQIFDGFPNDSWPEWNNVEDSLQSKKLSCERIEVFPSNLGLLVNELHSSPVLRFLESLTGINGLMPDPHLWGGGLHVTQPGGYLWPHTDFLQGQTINLMRVLNLILYVHSQWEAEMGGYFQGWNEATLVQSIIPKPGRCVIFKTDEHSIHGVSQVIGSLPRRSIALFYYAVLEKQNISLDHTTGWRLTLSPEGTSVSTMRRVAASMLMRGSFGLKKAAIVLNNKAEEIVNSRRT